MTQHLISLDLQREFRSLVQRVCATPVVLLDANIKPIKDNQQLTVEQMFPNFSDQLMSSLNLLKDDDTYPVMNPTARQDFLDALYHQVITYVHNALDDASSQLPSSPPTFNSLVNIATSLLSKSFTRDFSFRAGEESDYFYYDIEPRIHFYAALHDTTIADETKRENRALGNLIRDARKEVDAYLSQNQEFLAKAPYFEHLCSALTNPDPYDHPFLGALSTKEKAELLMTLKQDMISDQSPSDITPETLPNDPIITDYAVAIKKLFSSSESVFPIEVISYADPTAQPSPSVAADSIAPTRHPNVVSFSDRRNPIAASSAPEAAASGGDGNNTVISFSDALKRLERHNTTNDPNDPGNNRGV